MNRRRIDTVLRIRGLQERRARGEVGRARQELAVRESNERHSRALVAERADNAPKHLDAAAFTAGRMILSSGMSHVEHHRGCVVVAHDDVDTAMDAWRVEAERLDGIERLAARFAELAREEEARLEAAAIDDLVIARWPSKSRDAAHAGGAETSGGTR